jgi:FAD/FMN-containing dehydrogenase
MADLRIATTRGSDTVLDEATVLGFRTSIRGPLLRSGDAGYDKARQIWNGMMDKRPSLIVRCTGVADVIAAVNFARDHNLLVAIRGGGHNVAGNAMCDDGIVIDLSPMKGIRVDPQRRTVRVQGGATLGDLDRETQVFGLAAPAGVVSTTGVAGLTLGGGTGWQMRKRGLSIDNLLSVDIVTADGQVRVASETQNPDLFWAVRGGGGNFGVVTSFEFCAYPVGPVVALCAPFYPAELGDKVLRAWRDFMAQAPEEVGSALLYWAVPENPFFPAETQGRPVVIPVGIYNGENVEEGQRLMRPLRELGTRLLDLSDPIPWTAVQSMFDPFLPNGDQYYWKSLYLDDLGEGAVTHIVQLGNSRPSPNTAVILLPFGGAFARVAADATAFGRRDMSYLLELNSCWKDLRDNEVNIAWTRQAWSDSQRFSKGGLYLNSPGLGEEGERLVRSAVGPGNYQRLVALKNKYDPTNLFRLNQNIKPTV